MKNRYLAVLVCLAVFAAVFGSSVQRAAAAENTGASELGSTPLETYESEDGWSARYDSDLIDVREVWNGTEFSYTGEQNRVNKLRFRYLPYTSTDILLAEEVEDYSGSWLEWSEGYFAGRADIWAFHVDVVRNGWGSTLAYTAVEHNGGVLLIERTGSVENDEERGKQIDDTLADILDSVELTDHRPQTEYDYIPGTYVLREELPADGQTEYPAEIVLSEDHTGRIGGQEMTDIVWLSRDGLIKEDTAGGEVRFFTIMSESLFLQMDGTRVEYRKVSDDTDSADGKAAVSRIPASFRAYENDEGWLAYFDNSLVSVKEGYREVVFTYGDAGEDTDKLRVRYYDDDSTEDVLEDIEEDYDSDQILRSEWYFGGSREDWGFTISVPAPDKGDGMRRIYTAAEHNGGTLLVDWYSDGDGDSLREKALRQTACSFLFSNHDPQREYEDLPGRYALNDKVLSSDASNYPQAVMLNRDHTGTVGDTEIIWHCRDGIFKEAGPGGKEILYRADDEDLYLMLGTGQSGQEQVEYNKIRRDD